MVCENSTSFNLKNNKIMELLFNTKQKNVVAKLGDDYYFLGKNPKKLVFENPQHKKLVLKHFKPLKAIAEEHSIVDESLTLKQWKELPVWLENESKGAEGNLELTKFIYDNVYLYINGGYLWGNVQEYVLLGIIALYKQCNL